MSRRIRTTHVGSLPRPEAVGEVLFAEERGEPVPDDEFEAIIGQAVNDAVQRQVATGIDLVSDGEMSKISYVTYIRHRLTGFAPGRSRWPVPRDLDDFPEFRDRNRTKGGGPTYAHPECVGPIAFTDLAPLERDLRRLRTAMVEAGASAGFVNGASPGVIAAFHPNHYYPSAGDYLTACADAMRVEYEAIVAAGFDVQVDCPDLAMGRHLRFKDSDDETFLAHVNASVDALNRALENVPKERVRLHLCWGNYEGPHTHDVPLHTILPAVLRVNAGMLLFEAANPRHAHEWKVWREIDVPDDVVLAPGVIDTTTNFVEHPELVAERLGRFIDVVGPDRVVAGTDCGFGSFAHFRVVDPGICWAKLAALVEGAKLAV